MAFQYYVLGQNPVRMREWAWGSLPHHGQKQRGRGQGQNTFRDPAQSYLLKFSEPPQLPVGDCGQHFIFKL